MDFSYVYNSWNCKWDGGMALWDGGMAPNPNTRKSYDGPNIRKSHDIRKVGFFFFNKKYKSVLNICVSFLEKQKTKPDSIKKKEKKTQNDTENIL
jgi:hypothetical protein